MGIIGYICIIVIFTYLLFLSIKVSGFPNFKVQFTENKYFWTLIMKYLRTIDQCRVCTAHHSEYILCSIFSALYYRVVKI